MPGIAGLITRLPREEAKLELSTMVARLCHDTSYVTGIWCDERLGVYVGWAAREESFASQMPLHNEKNDVTLVFAGEEFPEPGTADRLKQRGHDVKTGPCEYLVHWYEEDPAFPKGLNGRFHGLIADQKSGTVTLFNDRYGMHRVYYHEAQDAFYFAAEAKAILAVRNELRAVEPRSLGEFISCGCVLENRSLFKKIQVLPPASAWVFQNERIVKKAAYFKPEEWEDQEPLEPEAYYERLRESFSQNLPRYFAGSELVGMSVTGGLDTRMILAWQRMHPGSLPCYSFGSAFRECQDVVLGRMVARACGHPHQVIPVGSEFLSNFARYAERTIYLTDGCVAVTHSPDLYTNERAAKIAPVRMTGNYGGEVLRRVRAFKASSPLPGLFSNELLAHIKQCRQTYTELLQGHPLSFAVFRQAPWHHYGLLSLEQTQLTLRSPFLDNTLVETAFRAPMSQLVDTPSLRLIQDGDPKLMRMRTDRGLAGETPGLFGAITRSLLEFTVKTEYAYDYGMPQWLARIDHKVARLHLERLFLGRHKFYHFRVWYRDALSEYVREMLLDPRTLSRPYLDRRTLESVVYGHLKGDHNFTTTIHKVLTLELVHRLLLESTH